MRRFSRASPPPRPPSLLKNVTPRLPGCQNKKLTPLLEGAPNFRAIPGLPVYGVAIPTAAGLRRVLDALGASRGRRRVVWVNLREEPVTYINGAPFVVREAARPFANLEYTGIDATRLEDMEARLRADVLREAGRCGGQVLVAHEGAGFQVVDAWEGASEADVQTPAAVYAELGDDGYKVEYVRLPITDEKAPKDADFAALLDKLWRPPSGAALVFNCQMGRGRTTTGMVIAALVTLRRAVAATAAAEGPPWRWALPPAPAPGLPAWFLQAAPPPAAAAAATAAPAASPPPHPPHGAHGAAAAADGELRAGRYAVVRSLLRALARGRSAKAALDAVVDAAEAMQNLREAVAGYRARLAAEPDDDKRSALLAVALEYLERYCVLITFSAYLGSPRSDPEAPGHEPFGAWMRARPELRSVLARMLRSNPLAALALHHHHHQPEGGRGGAAGAGAALHPPPSLPRRPPAPSPATPSIRSPLRTGSDGEDGADVSASETDGDEAAALDAAAALVAGRAGGVLGPCTILKEDHFPGCQAPGLPRSVPGAPNFRGVPGSARVYGSGAPTADGVAGVLAAVKAGGAAPHPPARPPPPPPVWVNLREEVCLYINGTPFVLREAGRPFKNMREYDGISARRLEAMEARLKADVLAEAAAAGGRVLVAREVVGGGGGGGHHGQQRAAPQPAAAAAAAVPGGTSSVIDTWEPVTGPGAVQTPREVYLGAAAAAAAGMDCGAGSGTAAPAPALTYVRVPLTDGAAPRPAAFDALVSAVAGAPADAPVIVSCQMGGGRTTTGMAVACLVRAALFEAALGEAEGGEASLLLARPLSPEGVSPYGGGPGGGPGAWLGADASHAASAAHRRPSSFSRIDGLSPRYYEPGGGTTTVGSEADAGDSCSRPLSPVPAEGGPPAGLAPISTARPALPGGGPASAPPSEPGSAMAGHGGGSAPWWQASAQHPPPPGSTSGASLVGAGDGGLDSEAASVFGGPSTHGGGGALAALSSADPASAHHVDPREVAAIQSGDYEGVRRFTRVLAGGEAAKAAADAAVDAAGRVVNLRSSIARYRRPRRTFRFYRPEIHARHAAFTRGLACLERYCWLIGLAAYLGERAADPGGCRPRTGSGEGDWGGSVLEAAPPPSPPSPLPPLLTFSGWVAARPDLQGAADAIRANPAGALAPVRAPVVPAVLVVPPLPPAASLGSAPPPPPLASAAATTTAVSDAELRRVLAARQGGTLTRRSILKSYCLPPTPPPDPSAAGASTFQGVALAGLHPGAPDVRTIGGGDPPIVTVGSCTVPGLAAILGALGCGPGGGRVAVLTDLREELAVYVRGVPYLRRELDQPAAALHHAGAPAASLEALERRLVGDLVAEAAAWGGRVLLHRGDAAAPSAGGGGGGGEAPGDVPSSPPPAGRPPRPPLPRSGSGPGGGGPASPMAVRGGGGTTPATAAAAASKPLPPPPPPPPLPPPPPAVAIEDVTVELDARPAEAVTPFWEVAGSPGDAAAGVATPRAAAGALRAAGFALRYARVPLSRERTPCAADLDALGRQTDVCACAGEADGRTPVHIFLSRTATGSSARFAAVLAAGVLALRGAARAAAAAAAGGGQGGGLAAALAARLLLSSPTAGEGGSASSSVADLAALDPAAAAAAAPGGGGGAAAWAVPASSSRSRSAPLVVARGGGGGGGTGAADSASSLFGTSPGGAGAMLRAGGWPGLHSRSPPSAGLAGLGGISEEEEGGRATGAGAATAPRLPPHPPPPPPRPASISPLADNRSLMNLCRVLPRGRIAQAAVDAAAEAAAPAVGDLRADVGRCEAAASAAAAAADAEPDDGGDATDPDAAEARRSRAAAAAAAARRLGLHYLQRYFYLVTFFSYLAAAQVGVAGPPPPGDPPPPPAAAAAAAAADAAATGGRQSFATWFADRRELRHLLSTLSFERGDGRG